MGVENMIKHYVPEIVSVEAQDGYSEDDPYYSDPYMSMRDGFDDVNNQ